MGRYYTELADVLTAAGVVVAVDDVNAGWESRARSSGGFAAAPLGVVWHHTASSATPYSDLSYMCHGSADAPIGNVLLDRNGVVWPIAAGAANTQGKGGPVTLSRGTVPVDAGNSQLFAIEAANSGTGEAWPAQQVDAYFATSNALNALFGNTPTDVITHAVNDPPVCWTDRKIDPATSAGVRGPWVPAPVSSSGTWAIGDIRAECAHRAGNPPPPTPGGLMFTILDIDGTDVAFGGNMDAHGIAAQITWLNPERYAACARLGAPVVTAAATDLANCDLLGPVPPGFNAAQFANVIT